MDIEKLDLTLNELSNHSPNILRLIEEKGMEGYDVYVALQEYLISSKRSRVSSKSIPGFTWLIDVDCNDQFLEDVILNYGLFKINTYTFSSISK